MKRLITEYDFVVVQMTKIIAHILRFFHLNNAQTWRVSALWCEKVKGQVHWFLSFVVYVNKIISVINFIHTRHQRNNNGMYLFWNKIKLPKWSNLIRNPVQYDHNPGPKWIMVILHWYTGVTCCYATQWRNCSLSDLYQWMVWNWFVPVPHQQLPL